MDHSQEPLDELQRLRARVHQQSDILQELVGRVQALEVKEAVMEERVAGLTTSHQLTALETVVTLKLTHLTSEIISVKRPVYAVAGVIIFAVIGALVALVVRGGN